MDKMNQNNPELVFKGHSNTVTALAFSADGKTLVSCSLDHSAIVWDVETGDIRRILDVQAWVFELAITPDGSIIVTEDGQVWDTLSGKRIRRSNRIRSSLAISPDGKTLAFVRYIRKSNMDVIVLADIRTGRTQRHIACGDKCPDSIVFSANGQTMVSTSGYEIKDDADKNVNLLHDLNTGESREIFHGQRILCFPVEFGLGVRLAAVADDGSQIWNAETGDRLCSLPESYAACDDFRGQIALSHKYGRLAVGTDEGEITIWDIGSGSEVWHASLGCRGVDACAFTRDSSVLAAAGEDKAIRIWDAESGRQLRTLGERVSFVEAVDFTADGQAIRARSKDKTAREWRISPPTCEQLEPKRRTKSEIMTLSPSTQLIQLTLDAATIPTYRQLPNAICLEAISPDGSLSAVTTSLQDISIWSRQTANLTCTMVDAHAGWMPPAFSPDNRYLATGSMDQKTVRLFDTTTGNALRSYFTGRKTTRVAFSKDGQFFAAGTLRGVVTVWNVQTGERVTKMKMPQGCVNALEFSPDGITIAVCTSFDDTVYLKRITPTATELPLRGHTDDVLSIAYSPNGTRIATGSQDGTTRLWDAQTGELLMTFMALPAGEWIAVSPDGLLPSSPAAAQWVLWRRGNDLTSALP